MIANGGSTDMNTLEDILKFKETCGASSVMVARAAQINVSIFREEGPLSIDELVPEYLKMCVDFDNSVANTKYSIAAMYNSVKNIRKTPIGRQFEYARSLDEIWFVFDCCCCILRLNSKVVIKSSFAVIYGIWVTMLAQSAANTQPRE